MTWIKMRKDLKGDPAVLWMSEQLDVRPEVIVGYLHAFWCWCDDQLYDGNASGVTAKAIGNHLALPGFPELLIKVGWLEVSDGDFPVLTIPNFEVHMSESAKKRAQNAQRQAKHKVTQKSQKSNARCVTREEKSREEIKPPPPPRDGGAFQSAGDKEDPADAAQALQANEVIAHYIACNPSQQRTNELTQRVIALMPPFDRDAMVQAIDGAALEREPVNGRQLFRDGDSVAKYRMKKQAADLAKATPVSEQFELWRYQWVKDAREAGKPEDEITAHVQAQAEKTGVAVT